MGLPQFALPIADDPTLPLVPAPRKVRSIFISDLHLGSKGCQADRILSFLRHFEAEHMYLVGDIIDFWALRNCHHWPQEHNDVVQKLLRHARKGTCMTYIPGNHDEFARGYIGNDFGGIAIAPHAMHTTAKGLRYLVTHGDQYDLLVGKTRYLAQLGGRAYDAAVIVNRLLLSVRRNFGLPYWSLSQWLKLKVKDAVAYIGDYEKCLVSEAKEHSADGVICGHIHCAIIHDRFGLSYVNCGDWVEDCTAIVELENGELQLIDWSDDGHVLNARIGQPVEEYHVR